MISAISTTFRRSAGQSTLLGASRAVRQILRIPLLLKVVGANATILAVTLTLVGSGLWGESQGQLTVVLAALTAACGVNFLLVFLALRPISELERMAARVSLGEYTVRATVSRVADPQLAHLTETINSLLDSLVQERRRIQKLGALVVSAQETERAQLARELHDSIAQTLAAAGFQISAAGAKATDDDMRDTLATARAMIGKAIDEVRNISYSLHPRVAEDLGLVSALEALAQQVGERGSLSVKVTAAKETRDVPATVAAMLFRVAQESLKSAERRAVNGSAEILLYSREGSICLEVSDDNRKLDSRPSSGDSSEAGLSSIKDRLALSGGLMSIEARRHGGVRVTAELRPGCDTP